MYVIQFFDNAGEVIGPFASLGDIDEYFNMQDMECGADSYEILEVTSP